VNLLEDLVDVGGVGLLPGLGALLLLARSGSGLLSSLLSGNQSLAIIVEPRPKNMTRTRRKKEKGREGAH
jgi:hypothetical protein